VNLLSPSYKNCREKFTVNEDQCHWLIQKKSECEKTLISDKDYIITGSLRWFRKMKQIN